MIPVWRAFALYWRNWRDITLRRLSLALAIYRERHRLGRELNVGPGPRRVLFREAACRIDGRSVTVGLEVVAPFRLVATVRAPDGGPVEVLLACAGAENLLAPVALGKGINGMREATFELPGFWWTQGDRLRLQVSVGGTRLPAEPVPLDVEWALSCFRSVLGRRRRSTYEQLLILEHARFIAMQVRLPERVMSRLRKIAGQAGLDDYLPVDAHAGTTDDAVPASRQAVSAAVREFNQRMPSAKGGELALLRTLEQSLETERQRESLRESVMPWFVRERRFTEVAGLIAPSHLKRLSRAESAWQVSLALPLLVAEGRLQHAAVLLRGLPDTPGWVVTECLAEATRQALAFAGPGSDVEDYGAALLSAAGRWATDYWSRSEDVQLIDACVSWLEVADRFSPAFRELLLSTLLQAYGLSPRFWEQVEHLPDTAGQLRDRLHEAAGHFRQLVRAVRDGVPGCSPSTDLRDALAYFRVSGNQQAARFLREVACARLLRSGPDAADALLPEMLALDAADVVRVAALPREHDVLPVAMIPALTTAVQEMQRHVPRARHAAIRGRLYEAVATAAADGVQCDDFVAAVDALDEEDACSLSVELLAAAWVADSAPQPAAQLTAALVRHLRQAMAAMSLRVPPQLLVASVARLRLDPRVPGAPALDAAVRSASAKLDRLFPQGVSAVAGRIPAGRQAGIAPDVVVVVYSCRKFLETRVRVIRETWMTDLQSRGIRCIVVVGDGDGRLDGDVLGLPVGDRYEDLPAKTLAMAGWVLANTDCQYLVKVDDDCLLNVPAYFDDPVYRAFHYYGRLLRPGKGGTDRRWHQPRSQGELARNALDKSPEPSGYADGGSGYCLSRFAMAHMLAIAKTPLGSRLVSASFMEDKLVGDLLSLAGVVVHNDAYYTLVRRRYGEGAAPVNVYENTFFPSRCYSAKLAHLDTVDGMGDVWRSRNAPGLWPKKLWPSQASVTTEHGQSNQLELLTPVGKAKELLEARLFVVSVMRNEIVLLPHFLRHYREMGVRTFIVVDNLSDDGTREMLLAQPDVVLYSADTEYSKSHFGVAWQQTVLASHCMNRWALVADADELLVCPDGVDLPGFVAEVAAGGHDAVRVFMVDMYPEGDLATADFRHAAPFQAAPWFDGEALAPWRLGRGAYGNAENYVSGLRHRLIASSEPNAFTAQKYCLVRYAPWMRFCAGMHNIANARVAPVSAWFAHFKYHAGFRGRVAVEVARKQHFGQAQDYRRYQGLLAGGAGFVEQGVSRRYSSPADFGRIAVVDGVGACGAEGPEAGVDPLNKSNER